MGAKKTLYMETTSKRTEREGNKLSWSWEQPTCKNLFKEKYMLHGEYSIEEVFELVANEISSVEEDKEKYKKEFYEMMINRYFIPAGRILANARPYSLLKNYLNCFTSEVKDSIADEDGIYDALKQDAIIGQLGGGNGFNVSKLRPKNSLLSNGGMASGPISFLKVFNQSAKIILTGGYRRSARIAVMDIDHPDIEEFITCKREDGELDQFNISVLATDKFLKAVDENKNWDLVFNGTVHKTVKAKDLYNLLLENAYKYNDPGILNYDIINKYNNGYWLYNIKECNACGEQVMQPNSICCLGALNLTSFVDNPFKNPSFNFKKMKEVIPLAIRFLDNVLALTRYPDRKFERTALDYRRIGLGFTGLGSMFAMMKVTYGSEESKSLSEKIGKVLRDTSYLTSVNLAKEKGTFTRCNNEKLLESNFIKKLPNSIKAGIRTYGLRNIALNTCAPTGTISVTVGNNCSSGIEPIVALQHNRRIRIEGTEDYQVEQFFDYAWLKWAESDEGFHDKPNYFVTIKEISMKDAIDIHAIFQKYIDASISKTYNLKPNTSFREYKKLFQYAREKELKGWTTFNPSGARKGILEYSEDSNRPKEIIRVDAPKRPKDLPCDIYEISVKKEKHAALVGLLHGSPYEIFITNNPDGKIDLERHKKGIIRKNGKGRYDLIVENGEEKTIIENISKVFDDTYGSLSRLISMPLRHSTPIQFIVDQLSRSHNFLSFERAAARVLKKYIKDGEEVLFSIECPECKSKNMIFKEGCVSCYNCGWSKCD
jgi:ribonucleoside-diphosphate reductase alpha chain